ncbi:MAG: hypothetical protein IJ007_03915 [Oscillospiraceae bacterium]|nr:hypothetical protein [Oscillospiraceae bacterium]
MAAFGRDVNLNPNEIPRMPMAQKKDCMVEIDKVRSANWKYSVIFSVGIFAFVMCYSIISTMYTLKRRGLLTPINPVVMAIPFVIIIFSLLAHSMSKGRIILTVLVYLASGVAVVCTGELVNGWLVIPCLVGAVMYYGMFTLCDSYKALSKEDGFPEFFDLASDTSAAKEIIERNKNTDEPLNPLTEIAIIAEKNRQEKEQEKTAYEE